MVPCLSEAANPDIASYATFNDFFARALREGARPLAQADWVCPADGVISQLGPIQLGQLIQAKGHHYSVTALLGGDEALAGLQGIFFPFSSKMLVIPTFFPINPDIKLNIKLVISFPFESTIKFCQLL